MDAVQLRSRFERRTCMSAPKQRPLALETTVISSEYSLPPKPSPCSLSPGLMSTNGSIEESDLLNLQTKVSLLESQLRAKNTLISQLQTELATKAVDITQNSYRSNSPRITERKLEEKIQQQAAKISEDKKTLDRLQNLNSRLMEQIKSYQNLDISQISTSQLMNNSSISA